MAVGSDDPFLTEVAEHLIAAGGKRLRPSMAIAAALTSKDAVSEDVIQGAAAVELVHLGSLYHDDVLDGAQTRRTVASVNAKWGDFMAIIAGDYLLARASAIAAELGVEVTKVLARTIAELCEGQVREHQYAFRIDRSRQAYEACIAGKTASLVAASAHIGALAAGMGPTETKALADYGHAFGMAFQVRDDVLDIVGTEEKLGKPAGNDLMEGVYTLPVIFALADKSGAQELAGLLSENIESAERDKALDIVRASIGIEEAIAAGQRWADSANQSLAALPDSEMTTNLRELANHLFDDLVN